MPGERPFPLAWGKAAVSRVRCLVLARLWGRWIVARLPVWLTATLVLERILGMPGLGTDWMTRVVVRDRAGLSLWSSPWPCSGCSPSPGKGGGMRWRLAFLGALLIPELALDPSVAG